MRPRRLAVAALCCLAIAAVASCGSDERVGNAPNPSSAPPTTAAPVPILSIEDDVEFYPACRNEVLDHDGVRWFQLEDYASDVSDITRRRDEALSVNREPWSATMEPFGRVASPGPGDDIGTLVIWADDVAYWRSDSGDLETWMVDDELDQQWVC